MHTQLCSKCQTRVTFLMDYLLKCYLDKFNTNPRNTLHDRRNRRAVVDYISTFIVDCSRGLNCNQDMTTREAVIAIIRYHDQNLANNGCVCMMGGFHNILYVALRLCFDWQLKDTGTVIALLERIYACEGSFERIFVGAIFGSKASHYITGWKSDFDSQEENFKAIVYFIDQATNGGLEVNCGGQKVRFVDAALESCGASPLELALELGLPDIVHVLLRFGALAEDTIDGLLRRLLDLGGVYPYNLVSCLQLIFRVIPKIGQDTNCLQLVNDSIIPLTRCGIQVTELKHLCRCCIRRRLWENYQLPGGIQALSIPHSLKRYLDIMDD